MTKPRIYDKDFVYVPAARSDVRKTFARIRREKELRAKVVPIKAKERKA